MSTFRGISTEHLNRRQLGHISAQTLCAAVIVFLACLKMYLHAAHFSPDPEIPLAAPIMVADIVLERFIADVLDGFGDDGNHSLPTHRGSKQVIGVGSLLEMSPGP